VLHPLTLKLSKSFTAGKQVSITSSQPQSLALREWSDAFVVPTFVVWFCIAQLNMWLRKKKQELDSPSYEPLCATIAGRAFFLLSFESAFSSPSTSSSSAGASGPHSPSSAAGGATSPGLGLLSAGESPTALTATAAASSSLPGRKPSMVKQLSEQMKTWRFRLRVWRNVRKEK
jgi:hypothetical protein